MLSTSVIIPTYNRADDLRACLDSIYTQTITPQEVIIVDDSDNDDTYKMIEQRKSEFKEKEIDLRYIRNHREKSSAIARNLGIEAARGDIIFFFDDDVILMNDYIERILEVYQKYPDCVGAQGHVIHQKPFSKFDNIMNKIIFHNYMEDNSCRVLPSTNITYPYKLEKIIKCEWLVGCNQSFKAKILKNNKYDTNFKRYSFMEDVDLSYRIYKKYGGLYITPYARLFHNISPRARMPTRQLIYMQEVHSVYLFLKNIEKTPKNILIFIWHNVGLFLEVMGLFIFRPYKNTNIKLLRLKYMLEAYLLCLKHIKDIRRGDLKFMDDILK